MNEGQQDQLVGFIAGLLLGAVVGATAAILTAPQSGRKTRRRIGKAAVGTRKRIEKAAGRKSQTVRFGPRVLDIDILLYADVIMNNSSLSIPHPHLTKRKFVLVPLAEIAPSLIHPLLGESISKILIGSSNSDLVKKI